MKETRMILYTIHVYYFKQYKQTNHFKSICHDNDNYIECRYIFIVFYFPKKVELENMALVLLVNGHIYIYIQQV